LIEPVAQDTTPEAAEVQRRAWRAMDGFERIRATAGMFRRVRRMLELRYDDRSSLLLHIHGHSLSQEDRDGLVAAIRE
jgi:hypothetical protein